MVKKGAKESIFRTLGDVTPITSAGSSKDADKES